jgi:polysaccharide export outer membrane protein
MSNRHRWTSAALAAAAAAWLSGCAHQAPFVWVDDLPPSPAPKAEPGGYVIGVGDVVSVRVWNQEAMTSRARVRPDGRISVPFLNDVAAVGLTPAALAAQLQARLKDFFNNPLVTVTLEEQRPLAVSVVGRVAHPGTYPLESGAGVLQALAAAGGLTEWADKSMLFVLREAGGSRQRIRMTLEALQHAQGQAAQFRLAHGDVVVAE